MQNFLCAVRVLLPTNDGITVHTSIIWIDARTEPNRYCGNHVELTPSGPDKITCAANLSTNLTIHNFQELTRIPVGYYWNETISLQNMHYFGDSYMWYYIFWGNMWRNINIKEQYYKSDTHCIYIMQKATNLQNNLRKKYSHFVNSISMYIQKKHY